MATFTKEDIKAIVERMAVAYKVEKAALPGILGCKRSTIANWAHYCRLPNEHLLQCSVDTGASIDWLIFAKAPIATISPVKAAVIEDEVTRVVKDALDYRAIVEGRAGAAEKMTNKLLDAISKCLNTVDTGNNKKVKAQ